jgi:peroxiredoxin
MGHIREIYGEFERRGTAVTGIVAQKMSKVREYLEDNPYPFPILVDEKRLVVRDYGVFVKGNFESYNIARPSVFILDGEGIIRYIYVGYHQLDYPGDEELLRALSEIRSR